MELAKESERRNWKCCCHHCSQFELVSMVIREVSVTVVQRAWSGVCEVGGGDGSHCRLIGVPPLSCR